MEKFKEKYLEEAHELMDELEKALLILESNPEDQTQIQLIFRIMHTLKGNSAMFGFEIVSEFTHSLETIYDLVRNHKLKVDKTILDITLASIDHLNSLFSADEKVEGNLKTEHDFLIKKIEQIVSEEDVEDDHESLVQFESKENSNLATYYINFFPNSEIFNNGTNPLFLIDELSELGKKLTNVYAVQLPGFSDLKPLNSYFGWEFILSTEAGENELSDVFIFVEDECDLEIVKLEETDLLVNASFVAEFNLCKNKLEKIGLDKIKTFSDTLEHVTLSNVVQSEKAAAVNKSNIISSIRVSSQKLDHLMNLVSELVTTQARLSLFAEGSEDNELVAIAENVQKLSRQLRDIAFGIVLIPIESMMTRFQRLVRDLSKDMGKEIEFIIEGADTELDKTIIEGLADPLMHILRNSIDHGIELPKERLNEGKPEVGVIYFKAFYSGTTVVIQISDDGKGIDAMKVRDKAQKDGFISPEKQLTKREMLDLIFLPGFSTAEKVTDVSGRGVGMDVVKRKISEIRGEVEIDSEPTIGTTITIKLPLTLSIIDGLLVKVNNIDIILPLNSVHKIYAVDHKKIMTAYNNVLLLDGEQIAFYSLREEFDFPECEQKQEELIVLNYEDANIALVVDQVVGEYQAVLKPLGKHYKNLQIFSGATILGDGTVALVMDTHRFIRTHSGAEDHLLNEL